MPQPRPGERYDPHVGAIDDHLLNPPDYSEIAKTALYFGLKHVDFADPAGIDIDNGELIVIVGQKKSRKTTLALNMVNTWCSGGRLRGHSILWETLESGQTPRKVKQILICMRATRYMINRLWGSMEAMPTVTHGGYYFADARVLENARDPAYSRDSIPSLFRLSARYALAVDRSPLQHEAIKYAIDEVNEWPLLIYGAPQKQGRAKALEMPGNGVPLRDCLPYKRWAYAADKHGVKIIVLDHTNSYTAGGDYERMIKGVTHVSAAVSELNVVIVAVCQASLTSVRAGGKEEARGGTLYADEANRVFGVKYVKDASRMRINCLETRDAPFPDLWVPMDKHSGLFLPDTYPISSRC